MHVKTALFAGMLLVGLSSSPVRAAIMNFNSLSGNFDPYSTFTEDNITLFAVNGPPDHFHDEINPFDLTAGALIFSSDGTPQQIIFDGGATPFTLTQLFVWDIDAGSGPISFTSSSGAVELVDSLGPVVFGPGFSNIDFVQIDVPDPAEDRFIGIDDVLVNSTTAVVPEPTTFITFLGVFACGAPLLLRRRLAARRAGTTSVENT